MIGRPKAEVTREQRTIRLLPDEIEAFKKEAKARGLPMMTWLCRVGRRAAGLDPE